MPVSVTLMELQIVYCRTEGYTDLADRLVELQYELTDRLTFYICGRKPGTVTMKVSSSVFLLFFGFKLW